MRLKAQSAMEYLMTYGWSILIIAVVLGALFSMGVFTGAALIGTSCVASSGYYCGKLAYSHTLANVVVDLGQNTGTTWYGWAVMYAPAATSINTLSTVPNALFILQSNPSSLIPGQTATGVTLPVNGVTAPVSVGTTTAGDIWVCYTTTTGATVTPGSGACGVTGGSNPMIQYSQIATLTARAT